MPVEYFCNNCERMVTDAIENRCPRCNTAGSLEFKGNRDLRLEKEQKWKEKTEPEPERVKFTKDDPDRPYQMG